MILIWVPCSTGSDRLALNGLHERWQTKRRVRRLDRAVGHARQVATADPTTVKAAEATPAAVA